MKLKASPITQHSFNGISFYLKRDDLLHSQFSGNKARKFMQLLNSDFPFIGTLIGHGSIQANSLYSLAALANLKQWHLEFYVNHIPSYVREHPRGNYRAALDLGAKIIDISQQDGAEGLSCEHYIHAVRRPNERCLFVPEGGRFTLAEYGIKQLADEILMWQAATHTHPLTVALPSGTGTTALYLNKYLCPNGIRVVTCACVGGDDYLRQQWFSLENGPFPEVLNVGHKHHFGKLYLADYEIWQALNQQTGVEFDLLYDPLMWRCLMNDYHKEKYGTLLYVHQGGILGNETMLPRYERKYGF